MSYMSCTCSPSLSYTIGDSSSAHDMFAQDELYKLHELAHLVLDELKELHDPHIFSILEL